MKRLYFLILLFLVLAILASCSTPKKRTFFVKCHSWDEGPITSFFTEHAEFKLTEGSCEFDEEANNRIK